MSSEKEILALEDKRFAAMTKVDTAALEALCHEQLLYTHSSGVTDSKATWIDSMRSGRTKYKSGQFSDRKVRVFGDVAFTNGKGQIEAEINGQPRTLKLNYLNAWIRTPQGWQFVAWQSAPQPAA